ncbi:hypothetical protein [Paenochrobactrum pullorum]|uniref:hypothetical protein n=1 Tax=Paenochrobactrum pullorum TaxID=1324351 RepID=UPI0035BBDB95
MREYAFDIYERTFFISEREDILVGGVQKTSWEVRKLCEDEFGHEYYHQLGNAYMPRRATKAKMKEYLREYYC